MNALKLRMLCYGEFVQAVQLAYAKKSWLVEEYKA